MAVHHSCSSCALVNIAKNLDVDQTVLTVKLNVDGNILQTISTEDITHFQEMSWKIWENSKRVGQICCTSGPGHSKVG